ncbi:MAG: hypothetical protein OXB84_02590 [Halobacteriovoraceae bacterium]|nr:hypothetical protein [Halobacteriovoraceae bacterium]
MGIANYRGGGSCTGDPVWRYFSYSSKNNIFNYLEVVDAEISKEIQQSIEVNTIVNTDCSLHTNIKNKNIKSK